MRYSLPYVHHRSILQALLHLTTPMEGSPGTISVKFCRRSDDGQGIQRWRNIAEKFNRLSRVHQRYRRETEDRRQTDGFAIAKTERNVVVIRIKRHQSVADVSSYDTGWTQVFDQVNGHCRQVVCLQSAGQLSQFPVSTRGTTFQTSTPRHICTVTRCFLTAS